VSFSFLLIFALATFFFLLCLFELLTNERSSATSRRAPSPESPQPFANFRPASTSLFPVIPGQREALTAHDLLPYLRTFNKAPPAPSGTLRVWSSQRRAVRETKMTSPTPLPSTLILRFNIPDILVAFVIVENQAPDRPLIIENVNCFGPREQVR
jgi:hypothetical protein